MPSLPPIWSQGVRRREEAKRTLTATDVWPSDGDIRYLIVDSVADNQMEGARIDEDEVPDDEAASTMSAFELEQPSTARLSLGARDKAQHPRLVHHQPVLQSEMGRPTMNVLPNESKKATDFDSPDIALTVDRAEAVGGVDLQVVHAFEDLGVRPSQHLARFRQRGVTDD